jgi:hypothetical protein
MAPLPSRLFLIALALIIILAALGIRLAAEHHSHLAALALVCAVISVYIAIVTRPRSLIF